MCFGGGSSSAAPAPTVPAPQAPVPNQQSSKDIGAEKPITSMGPEGSQDGSRPELTVGATSTNIPKM